MGKALRIYGEVLRLVRRLPKDTRPYYAKYARENFVNYREVDANDPKALDELFHRAYNHSVWVLNKVHSPPGGKHLSISFKFSNKNICYFFICIVFLLSLSHFGLCC